MFEQPRQNNIENEEFSNNVNEEFYGEDHKKFLKIENEKLQKFFDRIEDPTKQEEAELCADAQNLLGGIGGIFEKTGK